MTATDITCESDTRLSPLSRDRGTQAEAKPRANTFKVQLAIWLALKHRLINEVIHLYTEISEQKLSSGPPQDDSEATPGSSLERNPTTNPSSKKTSRWTIAPIEKDQIINS